MILIVLWYITAKNYFNNNATRKDLNTGLPFVYKVVKKYEEPPEEPKEPAIPDYSITLILPVRIVAIIAITIIHYKKRS
ncbi:MAG: hypothetical protein ACFFAQ_05725 [Promethearchaeota archaeon]